MEIKKKKAFLTIKIIPQIRQIQTKRDFNKWIYHMSKRLKRTRRISMISRKRVLEYRI